MYFGHLAPSEIDVCWPEIRQLLGAAFRDQVNIYSVDDYYEPLKVGGMQLWLAVDSIPIGAVITSIDTGSAMSVCTVHSLAGERLKEWSGLMDDALMGFAKANKCKAIEAVTRKGFSRVFPNFVEDGVIYIRMVE